jgi:hypothetical protein
MMTPTENLISNICGFANIAHYNLLSLSYHLAIDSSGIMSCPFPAPAKSLYLQGLNSIS